MPLRAASDSLRLAHLAADHRLATGDTSDLLPELYARRAESVDYARRTHPADAAACPACHPTSRASTAPSSPPPGSPGARLSGTYTDSASSVC